MESDVESALEEIYYFEVADAAEGEPGVGRAYQRVYASGRTGRSTCAQKCAPATSC